MTITNAELLVKVNDAIESIMDGGAVQNYSINGRSIQKYSLKELMDLQASLERKIAMGGAARSTVFKFTDPE